MNERVLIYTALTTFILGLVLTPMFIPLLTRLKVGQNIREDGPKRHLAKTGTPTMGGLTFLITTTIGVLIFGPKEPLIFIALFATIGYGIIGFLDDYIKVVLKRSLGLKAREKLLGQLLVAVLIFVAIRLIGHSTEVLIPFIGNVELGILYLPFILLVLLGASNATNVTDGLDGLLAGTFVFSIIGGFYIAINQENLGLAVFCIALLGSVLAFLVYNVNPAKLFMGDTGSLALGGAIATVAILTKTEVLLILLGGIFVIETLSVIIQVISFKLTGKRVFLMSPIHHHFELKGWSEWKIVLVFWTIQFFFTLIAIRLWFTYYR